MNDPFPTYNNDVYFINHNGNCKFLKVNGLMNIFGRSLESVSLLNLLEWIILNFNSNYELDSTPISEINQPLSTMCLSEVDQQLKKNLYNYPLVYHKFGEKYNNILSAARHILMGKKIRQGFDMIVKFICPQWSEACYLSWIKDLGTFILELVINKNYPIALLNYIEIHMLSGYDTYLHRKFDIKKDVKPFTTPRFLDPYLTKVFSKHIKRTIDLLSIKELPNCNFDDWVKYRDNWNLMGSATIGLPMKIKSDGFKKATRIGSKLTNCLYYSDDELLTQLRKYEGHVIRPFLKTDEAAKSRVVIGYDTRSYIRCSFLEQFIDNFNGLEKWTTVGDSPDQLFQVREFINSNIHKGKYRMICTDQSAFDQHQYKHLFIYAFNCICDRIESLNPQIREIRNLELYGMDKAKIYYPDGSIDSWKNGLLSGHKFTALIGSILNRSATLAACELSKMTLHFGVFQGDDALIFLDKSANYRNFLDQYKKLGLVVNPMKTWHGLNRTEYLHQVYIKDMTISLPMRAALGLYFKDPKSLDIAPDQYFRNNISQFAMANRRGLDVEKLALSYTRRFLRKYSNLTTVQIERDGYNYLHTPNLYGGSGFEPYVPKKYYRQLHVTKEADATVTSKIVSPYHYKIGNDPILTERWILKTVYAHLPAPGIKTKISLHRVDFTKTNNYPKHIPVRDYFNYDERKKDNTERWVRHTKVLLGLDSPFGEILARRFSTAQAKLDASFNLISSVTNAFLSGIDIKIWKHTLQVARDIYTTTKISISKALAYIEYWRDNLFKQYRLCPPAWYRYGFFF